MTIYRGRARNLHKPILNQNSAVAPRYMAADEIYNGALHDSKTAFTVGFAPCWNSVAALFQITLFSVSLR